MRPGPVDRTRAADRQEPDRESTPDRLLLGLS